MTPRLQNQFLPQVKLSLSEWFVCLMAFITVPVTLLHADIITIDGVMKSVDVEKRTITIESGAKERTLDVSSKAKISINGNDESFESLNVGQKVVLSFHDQLEVVVKIEAGLDEVDATWESLSEGDSLEKWTGNTHLWKSKAGVIHGKQPQGVGQNNLFTESKYRNFVLSAKFKVSEGNSGIFFRAEPDEKSSTKSGYQLDLRTRRAFEMIGGVEVEPLLKRVPPDTESQSQLRESFKDRDWNECAILADGETIRVSINGIELVEMDDNRYSTGSIGIQMSGGVEVFVKDLKISPLP